MREAGKPWGWVVVSGIISLLLGLMIVAKWPYSSVYVLGIFLGIDLIFIGSSWLTIGLALKRRHAALAPRKPWLSKLWSPQRRDQSGGHGNFRNSRSSVLPLAGLRQGEVPSSYEGDGVMGLLIAGSAPL